MPRIARGLAGGEIYHVINRGNRRTEVFHNIKDYEKFIELMEVAKKMTNVKLYSFVLMPNHFHFIIEPNEAEDLSKYMQWLLTSYVRYYNKTYKTSGHLWQGRYKSFIVQRDNYFLTLLNYVEQNPQRAKLKQWKFVSSNTQFNDFLDKLPIELPKDWEEIKKEVLSKTKKEKIVNSIQRQSPYGDDAWVIKIAQEYDIVSTINPRGRPKKVIENG
jgi:putative transposase